jgi:hypothetical protein
MITYSGTTPMGYSPHTGNDFADFKFILTARHYKNLKLKPFDGWNFSAQIPRVCSYRLFGFVTQSEIWFVSYCRDLVIYLMGRQLRKKKNRRIRLVAS